MYPLRWADILPCVGCRPPPEGVTLARSGLDALVSGTKAGYGKEGETLGGINLRLLASKPAQAISGEIVTLLRARRPPRDREILRPNSR
jgi:hypothetical protein